jgi:lipopolysaccharide biosynthesis glycosyltransferase
MIYNIVCIANDNYAQHACVMLTSLFETNKNKKFAIYLLTDDFSTKSEAILCSQCEKYNNSISIKKINLEDYGLHKLDHSRWNKVIYYKMFLPYILPDSADRCLFLDVDLIINHDIEELYTFQLDDAIIAGCEDMWSVKKHRERLHLLENDEYINSGVMVINLKNWRENGNIQKMSSFLKSNLSIFINEQDAFALYFRGYIKYLPTNQWNATSFFFHLEPHILSKYFNEIDKVRFSPFIIHFCFQMKPWYIQCKHPYGYLYKKYLDLTVYAGNIKNYENKKGRIVNFIRYWLTYFRLDKWKWYEIPLNQKRKQILKEI